MKKILIITGAIIIIVGAIFLIKELIDDKDESNTDKGDMIIKIENIENQKNNGYAIYANGVIEKQNYISGKVGKKGELSKKQLEKILKLVNEIDESKVNTIMTSVAITEGQTITVYNSNKKKIIIKDFYNTNYSDAANQIIEILEDKNLL